MTEWIFIEYECAVITVSYTLTHSNIRSRSPRVCYELMSDLRKDVRTVQIAYLQPIVRQDAMLQCTTFVEHLRHQHVVVPKTKLNTDASRGLQCRQARARATTVEQDLAQMESAVIIVDDTCVERGVCNRGGA